jgi:tripeptidyl-peptidase-1
MLELLVRTFAVWIQEGSMNFIFWIYLFSSCNLAAGTSASAPLWAGIITLLNQDRLNNGKKPLGFMNPVRK